MLITFRCRSYSSVTMFGDIALHLIKMMGHSGTIPGSIGSQDVPQALAKLQLTLAQHTAAETASQTDDSNDEEQTEPNVGLSRRAYPLLELLKAAIKDECEVMWE
ncbi:protein of unknown function [Vibrio xiamenensis]|uniref:DUF1840 domain-containing protein n=1 Tax=Vibrio xiamenensis TaxID=861298 RepID=A0A1G8A084_9VIBR|nr:DUF1840 domain-containing protein [Vibrio xiamenensis]SDH14345.1 protein of unknown function [Vibrio xiamenensis]